MSLLHLALFSVLSPTSSPRQEPEVLLAGAKLEELSDFSVVTPVGLSRWGAGDLLVVESHTHQRQSSYEGPPGDRLRLLVDRDQDGRPDAWGTDLAAGYRHALHVESAGEGKAYLVTRRDLRLLVDSDGDWVAEEDRILVRLETGVDYPHNALSGICVDGDRLFLGLGENFGAAYQLVGSDGSVFADEGGSGRIFSCGLDGSDLRPFASGLWNPFDLCLVDGRLYCIDNDPDASPPCRLLEVQAGDDFGYRYEFHRGGLHPLQAWDGELPGTKGMVAGVGEAPTALVAHGGWLWVTSWGEHRIERYRLVIEGEEVRAQREVVVQGLADFRPTGLALGADGALYFGDWVSRSYPVHGQGRIWRFELPQEDEVPGLAAIVPAKTLRERLGEGPLAALRVARDEGQLNHEVLTKALAHPRRDVRLCALRFAAELRMESLASLVQARLQLPGLDSEEILALLAADEWLDPERRKATSTGDLLARRLSAGELPDALLAHALRNLPPDHPKLKDAALLEALDSQDADLRREALWSLALQSGAKSLPALRELAKDGERSSEERAVAVFGLARFVRGERALLEDLAEDTSPVVAHEARRALRLAGVWPKASETGRPKNGDVDAWLAALPEDGDPGSGKRLFHSVSGPNCARCHRYDGRGARVGPDLTRTAGQLSRKALLTAILHPDRDLAPRYQPLELTLRDGSQYTGLLLPQGGDNGRETYLSASGERFTVQADDVVQRRVSELSIMPSGLEGNLTLQDLSDLLAFLQAE